MIVFNEYQRWAVTKAIYPEESRIIYPALGLASEAGEVCDKIKKQIRDGTIDYNGIIKELGDVLWYVAVLARDLGVDMDTVILYNKTKLEDRERRNKLGGSGDDR